MTPRNPILLGALVFGACTAVWTGCAGPAETPAERVETEGIPTRVAVSERGMVVSGSAPATRAGASVLTAGGNAVDAAVATAFALAVTEPTQSGLGGRTQALVRENDGSVFGIDGTTEVPAAYDPDAAEDTETGYGVIAIPGTVAALVRLHEQAGRLPLRGVMAPAIDLATDGFALSEGEADRLESMRHDIAASPTLARAFLSAASTPRPGSIVRQPELATTLRAIADGGADTFYRGALAEVMARDFAAHGAWVTSVDLAGYEAESSVVVEGRFGTLDLIGTYIPASGATTIEALQILDGLPLRDMDSDRRAWMIGRALLMAFEDRETAWNDARPPSEDATWITSSARASERRSELDDGLTPNAAPTSEDEPANTTHISVVDADGMAVAVTQSLGPTGGSRVVTDELGFLYATTLGGYLGRVAPGDRPWSSQSPLIGVRDGRTAYVLGGAGARRIISALVQTIVGLEALDLDPVEAMDSPRFHPSVNAWTFEQVTPSGPQPVGVASARASGVTVRVRPAGTYFARLNVIAIDEQGIATGIADARWRWGASAGPD